MDSPLGLAETIAVVCMLAMGGENMDRASVAKGSWASEDVTNGFYYLNHEDSLRYTTNAGIAEAMRDHEDEEPHNKPVRRKYRVRRTKHADLSKAANALTTLPCGHWDKVYTAPNRGPSARTAAQKRKAECTLETDTHCATQKAQNFDLPQRPATPPQFLERGKRTRKSPDRKDFIMEWEC